MLARRKQKRRIDDALATASPLALVEATDAHICSRSSEEVRALIERSLKRMDSGDRAQLALYVNLDDPDDLIAHRFSAFLRQNPRALAALDPEAIDSILTELGDLPRVEHPARRLPPRTIGLAIAAMVVALLPLAAQYAHQRGLLAGLSEPVAAPPPIVPFVEAIRAHRAQASTPARHAPRKVAYLPMRHRVIARHRTAARPHHAVALAPRAHRSTQVAWKFDPRNNPYMNRLRWRHPYVADDTPFGMRARLNVRSYLHALVAGNLSAALVRLGMPANGDTNALAELPIITRESTIAIVGSKPQPDGSEQVQADINTAGREYFAVFAVAHDGPAMRITAHYFIPVNRSAQIAARATRTE
jgi:hypothetical protein